MLHWLTVLCWSVPPATSSLPVWSQAWPAQKKSPLPPVIVSQWFENLVGSESGARIENRPPHVHRVGRCPQRAAVHVEQEHLAALGPTGIRMLWAAA